MLSLVCIIGTAPAEAKRNRPGVSTPKCTWKKPCSRMPLLPSPPKRKKPKPCNLCQGGRPIDWGTPMPRGGYQPNPGTQWR